MTLKEVVEYEAFSLKETFKDTTVWMYLIAFFALFAAINSNTYLVIFFIIIEIILQSKKHYESGEVREYLRKKYNIPNKTDIKILKEKNLNIKDI